MHYHSPQHGEPRLHRAARSPHGETQLPSSTTLPDQSAPLPGASAPVAEAKPFERMQAELKAVQQQALATQQSLKELQTRETADPYTAMVAELPGINSVNSALLGVGSALALGALIIWWYMWHKPGARFLEAPNTVMPPPAAARTATTPAEPTSITSTDNIGEWAPSTASGEFSTHGFASSSSFARQDPNMGFDPEAAATEVMRVRKSLADKREARAHFLEREDGEGNYATGDLDIALDLDLDEVHTPSAQAVAAQPPTQPLPDVELDLDLDPWRQPGETLPGTAGVQAADAIHFSLALEDYGVESNAPPTDAQTLHEPSMDQAPAVDIEMEKEEPAFVLEATPEVEPVKHVPGSKAYDLGITMALAQESASLELWSEARDLASEVLESGDPALVSEALSLLERLNQQELDAPPDTNWNSMR